MHTMHTLTDEERREAESLERRVEADVVRLARVVEWDPPETLRVEVRMSPEAYALWTAWRDACGRHPIGGILGMPVAVDRQLLGMAFEVREA